MIVHKKEITHPQSSRRTTTTTTTTKAAAEETTTKTLKAVDQKEN